MNYVAASGADVMLSGRWTAAWYLPEASAQCAAMATITATRTTAF